jgi:hypothetical protein
MNDKSVVIGLVIEQLSELSDQSERASASIGGTAGLLDELSTISGSLEARSIPNSSTMLEFT